MEKMMRTSNDGKEKRLPVLSVACSHSMCIDRLNAFESWRMHPVEQLWVNETVLKHFDYSTKQIKCHPMYELRWKIVQRQRFSCRITNLHERLEMWTKKEQRQTNKNVANNIQTFQTDTATRCCNVAKGEKHEFEKCWNKAVLMLISNLQLCRWHKWAFKWFPNVFVMQATLKSNEIPCDRGLDGVCVCGCACEKRNRVECFWIYVNYNSTHL